MANFKIMLRLSLVDMKSLQHHVTSVSWNRVTNVRTKCKDNHVNTVIEWESAVTRIFNPEESDIILITVITVKEDLAANVWFHLFAHTLTGESICFGIIHQKN